MLLLCAATALLSVSTPLEEPPEFHGFLSQGLIWTTNNNYLVESKRGNLDFTEVGINSTKILTEDLRIGAQLFTRRLGTEGLFPARFDWFYLDYTFSNWLGLRVGRVKLPFGLYNDSSDVDAARSVVLLPQSLYPIKNRDFTLAHTGVELHGYAVGLDYRLYVGTLAVPNTSLLNSTGVDTYVIDTPYVVGGRVLWDTPLHGLRVGGSLQTLELDIDLTLKPETLAQLQKAGKGPPDWNGRTTLEVPAVLWVASAEYNLDNLSIAVEYSQWIVGLRTNTPDLLETSRTSSERYYGMASYRLTPWLQPSVYASVFFPNTAKRIGRAQSQYDYAAALRFDLNDYWLLKLETHYMRGTASVETALNDNKPRQELPKDWMVFLAKTTVYF